MSDPVEAAVVLGWEAGARLADVSISQLRRLVSEGIISARKRDDGRYEFERALLHGYALRDPEASMPRAPTEGELAAAAAALFNDGKHPREVVVALKKPIEVVRRLHDAWVTLGRDLVVPAQVREQVEKLVRRPIDATTLHDVLVELARDRLELHRFTYPCSVCRQPMQATADGVWKWILQHDVLEAWRHTTCTADDAGA